MANCVLCGDAAHLMTIEIPDEDGEYNRANYSKICSSCWDAVAEVANRRMKSEITRLNNGLSDLISVVSELHKIIERLDTELKAEKEKRADEVEEIDNRLSRHIENCHGG